MQAQSHPRLYRRRASVAWRRVSFPRYTTQSREVGRATASDLPAPHASRDSAQGMPPTASGVGRSDSHLEDRHHSQPTGAETDADAAQPINSGVVGGIRTDNSDAVDVPSVQPEDDDTVGAHNVQAHIASPALSATSDQVDPQTQQRLPGVPTVLSVPVAPGVPTVPGVPAAPDRLAAPGVLTVLDATSVIHTTADIATSKKDIPSEKSTWESWCGGRKYSVRADGAILWSHVMECIGLTRKASLLCNPMVSDNTPWDADRVMFAHLCDRYNRHNENYRRIAKHELEPSVVGGNLGDLLHLIFNGWITNNKMRITADKPVCCWEIDAVDRFSEFTVHLIQSWLARVAPGIYIAEMEVGVGADFKDKRVGIVYHVRYTSLLLDVLSMPSEEHPLSIAWLLAEGFKTPADRCARARLILDSQTFLAGIPEPGFAKAAWRQYQRLVQWDATAVAERGPDQVQPRCDELLQVHAYVALCLRQSCDVTATAVRAQAADFLAQSVPRALEGALYIDCYELSRSDLENVVTPGGPLSDSVVSAYMWLLSQRQARSIENMKMTGTGADRFPFVTYGFADSLVHQDLFGKVKLVSGSSIPGKGADFTISPELTMDAYKKAAESLYFVSGLGTSYPRIAFIPMRTSVVGGQDIDHTSATHWMMIRAEYVDTGSPDAKETHPIAYVIDQKPPKDKLAGGMRRVLNYRKIVVDALGVCLKLVLDQPVGSTPWTYRYDWSLDPNVEREMGTHAARNPHNPQRWIPYIDDTDPASTCLKCDTDSGVYALLAANHMSDPENRTKSASMGDVLEHRKSILCSLLRHRID